MCVNAGTRNERTRKVSISTPREMMIASCTRNWIGMTSSAAKVAASTMPALVITPPVLTSPRLTPSAVPWTMDSSRTRVMRKML